MSTRQVRALRFGVEQLPLAGLPGTCRGILEPTTVPRPGPSIFGPDLPPEVRVVPHDCRAAGRLVLLGRSRFGNDVWVSREACEADVKILTGRITHHCFAGFTAGSKAVLPGVAGFETIRRNHRMVLSGTGDDPVHPAVGSGSIAGNPVHEEMLEAAALFRPTFPVNTAIDTEHEVSHAFCGDPVAAHEAGSARSASLRSWRAAPQSASVRRSLNAYQTTVSSHRRAQSAFARGGRIAFGGGVTIASGVALEGGLPTMGKGEAA